MRYKKSRRGRLHLGDLIEDEAGVDDGEECSSDEEVDNTYYDMNDSFIDDASQPVSSQSLVAEKKRLPSADMRSVYMQSLLSPACGNQFGRSRNTRQRGGVKLRVSHRHQFLRHALGYADSRLAGSSVSSEDDEAVEDNAVHDMDHGSPSEDENEEGLGGETLGEEDTDMDLSEVDSSYANDVVDLENDLTEVFGSQAEVLESRVPSCKSVACSNLVVGEENVAALKQIVEQTSHNTPAARKEETASLKVSAKPLVLAEPMSNPAGAPGAAASSESDRSCTTAKAILAKANQPAPSLSSSSGFIKFPKPAQLSQPKPGTFSSTAASKISVGPGKSKVSSQHPFLLELFCTPVYLLHYPMQPLPTRFTERLQVFTNRAS